MWRILNSVIYRVSAIYCNVFFLLHCLRTAEGNSPSGMCSWSTTSLNQFRMPNFLCKMDFLFFSLFTSRALHIYNLDGIILESMHTWSSGEQVSDQLLHLTHLYQFNFFFLKFISILYRLFTFKTNFSLFWLLFTSPWATS